VSLANEVEEARKNHEGTGEEFPSCVIYDELETQRGRKKPKLNSRPGKLKGERKTEGAAKGDRLEVYKMTEKKEDG